MLHTQSLAERFLNDLNIDDDPFRWIIVYDFIEIKPPPKFWKNLDKMMSISSIKRIQYSVLLSERKGEALAVAKLAEHYGAIVEIFQCIELSRG